MKKLFSLILLLIVMLKIGGFLAILTVQREAAKREISQYIKENRKIDYLFIIEGNQENLSKIEWEEEDKEFWFEGKLFDIVSIKRVNVVLNYYCLSDENEERVIAQIKQMVGDFTNNNPFSSTTKQIISLLFQPVICLQQHFPKFTFSAITLISKFPALQNSYFFLFASKLFIPPKI